MENLLTQIKNLQEEIANFSSEEKDPAEIFRIRFIGSNGSVEGDISGQQADIMGKVNGTIKVKELLQLKGGSHVSGNLYAGKLQIEPSANFNGQCHMTTATNGQVNEVVADKKAKELQKAWLAEPGYAPMYLLNAPIR